MNAIDELRCEFIDEAKDVKTFIDLNKSIGTVVMLDQMLMLKTAFLTVAFKGGQSAVTQQVHNLLGNSNYKVIDDFYAAGMRRRFPMNEYRQALRKSNSIRRFWEHNAYIEISKIKNNDQFKKYLLTYKNKLVNDIEEMIDINTLFDDDFIDFFKDNRWFKKCLM